MQAQQGSPRVPVDFRYQNPISSYHKFHSVHTESDIELSKIDNDEERTHSSYNDYDQVRTQSLNQGEMEELSGSYFHKSSFEFKAQTFNCERGTEDSAHSQESPLSEDSNQIGETEGNSNIDQPNNNPRDEKVKDTLSEKSRSVFTKSYYNEIEGQGIEHQAEKYNSSQNSPGESIRLDMPHSTPHSDGSSHGKSASPVTLKPMLVSPRSPYVHLSQDGHRPLSSQEGFQERLHSPSPNRQKHSSPKRSNLAKRISAYDHLSPSATQTQISPRWSQQVSRHKDGSSLKRLSVSPEPHYSPKRYGRSNRPISRSPIRRRDPASGCGRDYHDRSHSRSPYTRDRYRSPRRRYSPRQRRRSPGYHSHCRYPRRRSPGYHSHCPSPRWRPWSPPPNRKTGLGKPGKILFIAGFSFLTTKRDLERKFSRFGRVQDVRIVRDKRSGDSRGFGFLSLDKDEEADAAIRALDETEWNGRIILVEKSKST